MNETKSIITLDSYIRNVPDQPLKGLLLKLKNEIRKKETGWEDIKSLLREVYYYDETIISEVITLIILEE